MPKTTSDAIILPWHGSKLMQITCKNVEKEHQFNVAHFQFKNNDEFDKIVSQNQTLTQS